jgi:hypothetical protein
MEYICIDENAESIGSSAVEANMDLTAVEIAGGVSALTNYTAFYEATCVLCSSSNTSQVGSIFTRSPLTSASWRSHL